MGKENIHADHYQGTKHMNQARHVICNAVHHTTAGQPVFFGSTAGTGLMRTMQYSSRCSDRGGLRSAASVAMSAAVTYAPALRERCDTVSSEATAVVFGEVMRGSCCLAPPGEPDAGNPRLTGVRPAANTKEPPPDPPEVGDFGDLGAGGAGVVGVGASCKIQGRTHDVIFETTNA